ncbi:hypothetical protein T4E_7252 [Trichinella pseudospiralis]|uniref:Uncharacterized protein n=1 Tax=Trichinella pseudospiralis TaxID=6337 RepID=A0A0V0Y9K6_TRIPS|nr:hypothetical protein T4E_7252 [Trichinella pseudospiralis]
MGVDHCTRANDGKWTRKTSPVYNENGKVQRDAGVGANCSSFPSETQTVDAWSESNRMNVKWRKALKTRRRSNYGGLNEARRQAGGQVCDACARRCRQHCWYGFGKSVVKVVTKKLGMNQRRTMTSLQLCCGSFPSVLTKQKALTQTGSSRDQRRPCCDN